MRFGRRDAPSAGSGRHGAGAGAGRARRVGAAVASVALVVGVPALSGVATGAPPAAAAIRPAAATGAAGAARRASSAPEVVSRAPALPAGADRVGAVPGAQTISGAVALDPGHAAALAAWAAAVSSPRSRAYRHFFTPAEAATAFAPAPGTVAHIESVLRSRGLSVSAHGLLVDFHGPAARVESAFSTAVSTFRLDGGRRAYANTVAAHLPASVAGSVQAVIGLNDLVLPHATPVRAGTVATRATRAATAATAATATGPVACPQATKAASTNGGLTDAAIAHAYGVDGLYSAGDDGKGQTIAVYELEPFKATDIAAFDTCYFGASQAAAMAHRLSVVPVDGGVQAGYGSGESELDIQDVSALAPGAAIDVYEAPPTDAGYLDELDAIVDDDAAHVVTSSYGSGCETQVQASEPGLIQVENDIFEQAAVEGQTFLDAAGDSGSDGCAYRSATPVAPVLSQSDPASQPYVTAVGGTTIEDATDPPAEQVWNDGAGAGAGGGGISAVWSQPAWQADSAVPGIDDHPVIARAEAVAGNDFCQGRSSTAAPTPCREVPDVSAQADEYTGAITIYFDHEWITIGGTSSSTPLWAAMLADVNQSCGPGGSVGFANPSLYAVAGVPAEDRASFNDVTVSDNDEFAAADGSFPATPGYDMATGLGSPRLTSPGGGRGLAYYLCHAAAGTARPDVTGVSPTTVSAAAGTGSTVPVTLTVSGSGFASGGSSDVAGVTIGTYAVPGADVDVTAPTTLTVTVPPGAVQAGNPASAAGTSSGGGGTYDVTVTRTGGLTSVPTAAARLTVYDDPTGTSTPTPAVAALTPSGGNEAGGSVVRIYGSGFASGPAPIVTFGGVAGTDVTVLSDRELAVRTPAYSDATSCLAADAHPTTDVCQTEVVVTVGGAASATVALHGEYHGDLPAPTTAEGVMAGPTEFDYVPTPHVASVQIVEGSPITAPDVAVPTHASESGLTLAVVHGTGFGYLGLDWVDVGSPALSGSVDEEIFSVTATSIELLLPNTRATTAPEDERLAVQTVGSPNIGDEHSAHEPSNVVEVPYAPTPKLTSIVNPDGRRLGPTSGGTRLVVSGSAFVDDAYVQFESEDVILIDGTDYDVRPSTAERLTLTTPPELAGIDQVQVCNDSGCSGDQTECEGGICITFSGGGDNPATIFTFYPPGRPSVDAVTPRRGATGSEVVIRGTDLGLPEAVYFGRTREAAVSNVFEGFAGPDFNEVVALVPKGRVGSTVDIRVVTAESLATETDPRSPVNPKVTFTFTKPTKGSGGGLGGQP
jgi:hypothetical protein